MKKNVRTGRRSSLYVAIALSLPVVTAMAQITASSVDKQGLPDPFVWATVANSATVIPSAIPGDTRTFNSFNQPSVNSTGLVVLRARSKGGQGVGEPLRGIYARQMGGVPAPMTVVFDTLTEVPQPNNTWYAEKLGTFTEFPAFPRIGLTNKTIASRAQSKPVWTYTPSGGTETRAGTSGVYVMREGQRVSAMTQLGAAPGLDYFSVPGAPPGTKFDQFPGAPAVARTNAVAFKGNYADAGQPKTGIFFRSFNDGDLKTQVIASSNTLIPGQSTVRFGSTAPPSAAETNVVFLGLDNEENPTMGGIYRAQLGTLPTLQTLVSIGEPVPGESAGMVFNKLGEALSYDGRFVAFWGAWGSATRTVTLNCPAHGQKDVIAFCMAKYPQGYTVQIPSNQGFFVHDGQTRRTFPVVKTGAEYLDFLYWTFSGRPPGVGHSDSDSEDFEEPRWRSAAFAATYSQGNKSQVAFKGRKLAMTDGIYVTVATASPPIIRAVVETGMDGAVIDPQAPGGVPIISVGLERDGLRNGWLAISASMGSEEDGWAGVYLTRTAR